MKRALLSCALIFWANASLSEPILVRSGEHDNFTRLVLPIPESVTWNLDNRAALSILTLEEFDDGFDLSQAFNIIPRTRLTALLAQSSTLEIQLACDCPVSAFVEEQFLVIDIFDEIFKEQNDDTIIDNNNNTLESRFLYGELLWGNVNSNSTVNTLGPVDEAAEIVEMQQLPEKAIVQETQDRLLEAFSSAASQGLVTVKQHSDLGKYKVKQNSTNSTIYDSSSEISGSSRSLTGNIRVSDSKDIPPNSTRENLSFSGAVCPDPNLFDVSSWGTEESVSYQLGKSNKELYDDLERINIIEVKKRAQLYLYFGFGAEAIDTLSLVEGLIVEHPELVDLARIMEFNHVKNPRMLHRFADCDSLVALWSILAADEIPIEASINAPAALRALANLPSHLKYFLAPELSDRLLKRGDTVNAKIAIRSFEDLSLGTEARPNLVQAKVYSAQRKSVTAAGILDDIVESASFEAPEAISAIVNVHIAEETKVPAQIALLAEAYAFELQNSEYGEEMLETFIQASASSGQYAKSINALTLEGKDFSKSEKEKLASYIFLELSKHSSSAEFVSTYFAHYSNLSEYISPEVAIKLANRLVEQGFTEQARDIGDSLPHDFNSNDFKELKAQITFELGDYEEALKYLDSSQSMKAKVLRAKILEMAGYSVLASEEYTSANLTERASTALWLADDWLTTVDDQVPIFGIFRQLAGATLQDIPANNEMLKESEMAISSSENARVSMEEALSALVLNE